MMTIDKVKQAYELVKKIQEIEVDMKVASSTMNKLKGNMAVARDKKTQLEQQLKGLFGGKNGKE